MPRCRRVFNPMLYLKPEFYHKAQPGGFYGFYEGGFYVGFINLKVYHNSHNQLLPYSFFLC